MTRVVADELLGRLARQQNDLFRRVREGVLDPEEVFKGLQALIETKKGSAVFSRDMTKEGWKLFEDVGKLQIGETSEFEFVPILKQGENSTSGVEMRSRAKELGCSLGQLDAEYFLAHPGKIPARPEGVYWIPFPGTVWRRRDGDLGVPYLFWGGERWLLYFGWLEFEWLSGARFLRPRK